MRIRVALTTVYVSTMFAVGSLVNAPAAEVERVHIEAPGVALGVPGDVAGWHGGAGLTRVLWYIQERTGYQFRTVGFDDPEIAGRQLTLNVDGPVKRVVEEICAQAGCSAQRVNPTTFLISPYDPGPDDAPVAKAGDYRVRVRSLAFSLGTHQFGTAMMQSATAYGAGPRMTVELEIDAPDSGAAACIFGLGERLRIVTDQGDELAVVDDSAVARANSGMNSYPDPTTPSLRLDVALPPATARTLSIEGELALWKDCKRVTASLPWGKVGQTASGAGVDITTAEFDETPDGTLACALRVSKPRPEAPDIPGIPGVLEIRHETQARLIWPWAFALATPEIGTGDLWRFSFTRPDNPRGAAALGGAWGGGLGGAWGGGLGRAFGGALGVAGIGEPPADQSEKVEGPPQGIAIWTYVKADPTETLPFKIDGIRLPDLSQFATVPLPEAPAPAPTDLGVPLTAPDQFTRPGAIEFDVLIDGKPFVSRLDWRLLAVTVKLDEDKPRPQSDLWRERFACLEEDGRFRIRGLPPGEYQLLVRPDHLASSSGPVTLPTLLRETYGIDPANYTWANAVAYAEVKPGDTTRIEPIRFVPKVHPLRPRSGETVARDNVVFAWEPHPDATTYRVSLGVFGGLLGLPQTPPSTFWVSDAVEGTEVAYDPQTGHVQREVDRHYKLEPGISYYWWVSAIDAEGNTITRAHGGGFFQVK